MRFAWLHKHSTTDQPESPNALIRLAYNAIWWIPIVLPLVGIIDYGTGFIAFTAITLLRFSANLYLNNALTLEQAERFPFRA